MSKVKSTARALAVLLGVCSGGAQAQGVFDLERMQRDIYGLNIDNCRYGRVSTPGDMTPEKRIEVCSAMIKQRAARVPRIRPAANTVTDLDADELAVAYDSRAAAYADLRKYDLALADMQKAVGVIEDYFLANKATPLSIPAAGYYLGRGVAFGRIEQFAKANSDFFTCVRRGPSKYTEYCVKNILHANTKLKQSGGFDRDNARNSMLSFQSYGIQLGKKSEYQEALNWLNTAVTLARDADDPNLEASVLYFRGITFWRMKNNARAGGDLNKCINLSTDAELSARCQDILSKI